MKPAVYLSGPMMGLSIEQVSTWRAIASTILLAADFDILDPCSRILRGHFYSIAERNRVIVESDKKDIDNSSILLVNTIGSRKDFFPYTGVGAAMEMEYAWAKGKTIVSVCPFDRPEELPSPWFLYHSHYRLNTLEDALELIIKKFSPKAEG